MTAEEYIKIRTLPTFSVIRGGKAKVLNEKPVQCEHFGKELTDFLKVYRSGDVGKKY